MKNPIVRFLIGTLAVAAVILAPRIYEARVATLTRSYGGIPMPDLRETEIERIERYAAKAEREAVAKVQAENAAFTNCLNARVQLFEFYQKLGMKPTALEPCGHEPKH